MINYQFVSIYSIFISGLQKWSRQFTSLYVVFCSMRALDAQGKSVAEEANYIKMPIALVPALHNPKFVLAWIDTKATPSSTKST